MGVTFGNMATKVDHDQVGRTGKNGVARAPKRLRSTNLSFRMQTSLNYSFTPECNCTVSKGLAKEGSGRATGRVPRSGHGISHGTVQ